MWKDDDNVIDLTSFVYDKLKDSTLSRLYLDELPSDAINPEWTLACLIVPYFSVDRHDNVPVSVKNLDWVETLDESEWRIVFLVGGEVSSVLSVQYERIGMLENFARDPVCMEREKRPYLRGEIIKPASGYMKAYMKMEK